MIEEKTVRSERLGDSYKVIKHDSGLTMLLAPMPGFSSAYAMFATAYGSIDTRIRMTEGGEFEKLPEGIAHYLEHKLFESEDGDAFQRYAKTGASANAFTAFDRTSYLFSCTDRFEESLEILLDFATHPYFTAETVAKEQGIIGQEIRMYDDSPDWRVLFNLLGAMYVNHPVKIDIAGTVESIAQINAELLYRCYGTFYNLRNMVLVVAGNFDTDTVLRVADRVLKKAPELHLERAPVDEPDEVASEYTEQKLPVSVPMFQVGFKGRTGTEAENMRGSVLDEIFLEALCGEASELYRRLYDDGVINSTFGTEVFSGRDYISMLVSGESRDPRAVFSALKEGFASITENGIAASDFEEAQKTVYGHYVRMGERVEGVASALMNCYFPGVDPYELCEIAAHATAQDVVERAKTVYSEKHAALSVITPPEDKQSDD